MPRCTTFFVALLSVALPLTITAQQLEIHTINVGWGASVLVKGPNGTTVLLDAGNTGDGTNEVVPYLQSIGITPAIGLDYTIVGHQHCDHAGGMDEVINAGYGVHIQNYYNGSSYSTGCITDWNTAAAGTAAGAPVSMAVGTQIHLGYGAKLTCVARNGSIIGGGSVSVSDENDRSIAVLVQYGGFDFLWASDMGGGSIDNACTGRSTTQTDVETYVIQAISPGGASPMISAGGIDVLYSNHHGSESSTNKNWMNLARPAVAVISTGAGQTAGWDLPRIDVVEKVLLAQATSCITVPAAVVYQTEEGAPTGALTSFAGYCVGNIKVATDGASTFTVSADGQVNQGPNEVVAAGLPRSYSLDNLPRLVDSYYDGNFTSGPAWGGTTTTWQIVASSDVAAGATNSNTLRLNQTTAVSGTQYLRTQRTASWGSSQSWSFWMGRRAQAATAANHSLVWLWANETNLTSATVDGYRVRFGDDTGNDEIVLQRVTNGVATDILTSSGSVTNALTDIGFMVRVTRTSGSVWTLYTSALPTVSGSGAVATAFPTAANTTVNQGTVTNSTYTSFTNGYIGVAAVHSSGASARVGAEFDQVYFDTTSVSPLGKPDLAVFTPDGKPTAFKLHQNFPNPFNPTTTIRFDLATDAHVKITLFDILGRQLSEIYNTEQVSGSYDVLFDGSDYASGLYVYKVEVQPMHSGASPIVALGKMSLVK